MRLGFVVVVVMRMIEREEDVPKWGAPPHNCKTHSTTLKSPLSKADIPDQDRNIKLEWQSMGWRGPSGMPWRLRL